MVILGFSALAFFVVVLIVVAAVEALGARRAELDETVEVYAQGMSGRRVANIDVLRTERSGLVRPIDELVKGTSWAEDLELAMLRAGLPLKPGEYVAVHIASAAVFFAIATLISGTFLVGILFVPLSYLAIRFYVRHRQRGRIKAFEAQLPDAIELMSTCLKSGFGLLQGLETVARELPQPTSQEFSNVVRNISVGMQLDDAFASMCRRVPSHDVYLVATAILVHKTVGGNLSEVLAGIAHTIRARLLLRDEVHALTTDPRVSGYIISSLPFFVFLAISLMNPTYISTLLGTGLGRLMLLAAVGMLAAGMLLLRRFTDLDY